MATVSDTSPINYLLLIGHVEILPALFGQITIPPAVVLELQHTAAPQPVRLWISNPPIWLVVQSLTNIEFFPELGRGEREAISLAIELGAESLLVDDRMARQTAQQRGIHVAGTLNLLTAAGERDLLDLKSAINDLLKTNFRASRRVISDVLSKKRPKKNEE